MLKNTNVQRSIVLPKDMANKIQKIADENFVSFNSIVKMILVEYFKKNNNNKCQEK